VGVLLAGLAAGDGEALATAGAEGGEGLALRATKAIVAAAEGTQVIDQALVLVRDGRIEAVGSAQDLEVPQDYALLDLGASWLMPGMVDIHSHAGGTRGDINDMVYQTNPGLRVSAAVVPANSGLQRPIAAGITSILFIPGSGTNIGGQGFLMKTGLEEFERARLRDPGSMKLAQGDNPTRWGYRMGRVLMNYHMRSAIRRGLAYAERWEEFEAGRAERPERDIQLDIFRELASHRTQISVHTQYYQLVMMSVLMLAREYGFDVYIDHGSFDSYLTTPIAIENGVAAILGPREVMVPSPPRYDTDGQIQGTAWGFQQRGHPRIGFNTDAPVVPQEELPLQAAMGVRYGLDDEEMIAVRGITIVPALTAGLDERLGSLEPGKDADLVVVSGNPIDPRSHVELVFVEGACIYDAEANGRRW